MQRQNLWLNWLFVSLALGVGGCITVDFVDPEADPADESTAEGEFAEDESFLPDHLAPATTTPSPAPPEPERKQDFKYARWDRNPSRAISKARSLKRPLLILFTALSWNEKASLLSSEVFMSKTFNEFAGRHLILTFLDYPRTISDAPDSLRAMKKKYGVNGFPTLLLVDAKGNEIFRHRGYQPGRARDYFNELRLATLQARGIEIEAESEPAEDLTPAPVDEPEPGELR